MTQTMSPGATARPAGSVPLRACAWGIGASAVAVLAVVASGLLPAGAPTFVLLGAGVAALSGCAGTWLQAWLSTTPKGHPQLTQRFVWGLIAPFLLQVATVAVGCLVLVLRETKFEATAAFGLSFAAVATTLHTVGVMVVARSLRREGSARHSAPEGPASLLLDGVERLEPLIRAEPGGTVSPSLRGGNGHESEKTRA